MVAGWCVRAPITEMWENTPGPGRTYRGGHDDVSLRVAELLRMPISTVYELARNGVHPASRLGRTWRFLRPRLEQLLAA
jgi:excisionase family DNA binding protein